ncbi:MAG TPA: hypothetical protein VGX50_05235 [Longimicrobium sp.]|jgi:hypothetical protein|nr:hypothetical protein [Longimicrobium sp.]
MFTFPLSAEKHTWNGQGAVVTTISYHHNGTLGACFGICCAWIANAAVPDCLPTLCGATEIALIDRVQTVMIDSLESGLGHAMDVAALQADLATPDPLRTYPEGTASHVILDLLSSRDVADYIIAFYYTKDDGANVEGHAIAVSFDGADRGTLLDPNYGTGRYTSRTSLCNDLHTLLRTYVSPEGYLTESNLMKVKSSSLFDEFQSAVASA